MIVWLGFKALSLQTSNELTSVMQGVDAGVSLLIVLGGAAFYLSSLESRWRRGAVCGPCTSSAPSPTSSTCTS
ncbi:MAG: hypothetical protein WDN31_12325 [Hyphomicrobium sp.]